MTCIGGRRPVRILRGDCIITGYADTGTTNEGVSFLLFLSLARPLTLASRTSIRLRLLQS